MISIFDDATLVSCDKAVVGEKSAAFTDRCLRYVVANNVSSTSVPESHQVVVGNEKKTTTSHTTPRTDLCTFTMFLSVHTNGIIVLKPIMFIDPKAQTGQHRRSLNFYHNSHENNIYRITSTPNQKKKEAKKITIAINDVESIMVRFATINSKGWQPAGQDGMNDQDYADLSPQMIKTTADVAGNKNDDFEFQFDFGTGFELFPKPGHTLGAFERRQGNEEKVWFTFENATSFLEEMGKAHASADDKMKWTSIEGQNTNSENAPLNGENAEDIQASDGEENSTIASSSSSAVFELFDDVSMLTDDDSLLGDDDVDKIIIDLQASEEISLLTEAGIEEFYGVPFMVFSSFEQSEFLETGCYKEQRDTMEDFFMASERIVYTGWKDHNVLDFLSGVNCEKGFSPSDKLRLA